MAQSSARYPDRRLFLVAVCVLAATPLLRVGDVQALEILLIIHVAYLLSCFMLAGFSVRLYGFWKILGVPHAVFLIGALVLAVASLRFKFYPPPDITLLKSPLMLSI